MAYLALKRAETQNAQSARLRRQRGYRWEETLRRRFNQVPGWKAFRLGSSSISLPDIVAVSGVNNSILVIEAKSGTKTTLSVPPEQIERCIAWCDAFDRFKIRQVVLAFKFLSKKRIDIEQYKSRSVQEHYKMWNMDIAAVECVCTYEGKTYSLADGVRRPLLLEDCVMPFHA